MPCVPFTIDGKPAGFVCYRSRRGPKGFCVVCRVSSVAQCDGPRPPNRKRGDCDRHLCSLHRTPVGPDVDLCPDCLPLLPELVVKGVLMSDHHQDIKDILLESRLRELGHHLERAEAQAQSEADSFKREHAGGVAVGIRKALELLDLPELVGARVRSGNQPPPAVTKPPQSPTAPAAQASELVTTPTPAPTIDPADMGRCSSCKAPIRWVVTEAGKAMPVDYEPVATGNLVLSKSPDGKQLISKAFDAAKHSDGRRRWVSHFATCPQSKTHRRAP